jgi:hypothetical protein
VDSLDATRTLHGLQAAVSYEVRRSSSKRKIKQGKRNFQITQRANHNRSAAEMDELVIPSNESNEQDGRGFEENRQHPLLSHVRQ